MRHCHLSPMIAVLVDIAAATAIPSAFADGCAHERGLNAAEQKFVADRIAAAKAAFPAAPSGWTVYAPDAGLRSQFSGDYLPTTVCEDFGTRPLALTIGRSYTPQNSTLMAELAQQRARHEREAQMQELQKNMQSASASGDYDAMQKYAQQMQLASAPPGAKLVPPLSDAEYERRNTELEKKLEQAQQRDDSQAMLLLSGQQMQLVMLKSGIDTSTAIPDVTNEQLQAAPRVHVVVEYNANGSPDLPPGAGRISYGGSAQGWAVTGDSFCYDAGGPARKEVAVLLFGAWQPRLDFKNDLSGYAAPAADKGPNAGVGSYSVRVCGDPATVEKMLPTVNYAALKP